MKITNIITNIIIIASKTILITLKSIWNATIHIVWGIATIFLLAGLMAYFNMDASPILGLLEIANFLMVNWILFWWVFLALDLLPALDKLGRKESTK